MPEARTNPTVEKVLEQVKSFRGKRMELATEHPDLRAIRCNRAAKESLRELEHARILSEGHVVRL
ncbi:MAG: hypothetical protein EAX81_06790 [Candidatus Thorarchaeota archaeon]|nr:hypothetical protein [Candidatus Thorarchaeota archaeon]